MCVRKKYFFIILSLPFFSIAPNKKSSTKKSSAEGIATTVKTLAQTTMRQYHIPGMAIAFYTQGKPYLFHFGYADKNKKTPISATTLFEIGSVTKIFTCLLLAQEVIDGHMQLIDPISTHIPTLTNNKKLKTITLEKLATHTSTLPFNAPPQIKTQEDLLAHILRWRPSQKATLWWQYSNHGIELIRIALEESLHKSFDQLVIDRVLVPLNMAPVGVKITQDYQPQAATGYGKDGSSAPVWHHPFLAGTGALRASSADMLCFLKATIGLPGTPTTIKKAMELTQTPHVSVKPNIKYGLGWQINDLKSFSPSCNLSVWGKFPAQRINPKNRLFSRHAAFDKTGTTDGFHAYIAVVPSKSTGIVVMINRALPNGWSVVKKLGKEILFKTHALRD